MLKKLGAHKTLAIAISTPPRNWTHLHSAWSGKSAKLELSVDDACITLARLSAYLGKRAGGADHDTAVRHQNMVASLVRRALGYRIPYDDIKF